MQLFPLSLSGPASAMLLTMGMTPLLPLDLILGFLQCMANMDSYLIRLQAAHYVASQAPHRTRALA